MTTTVISQTIADQIVTAIEGGSTYWCRNCDVEAPDNVVGFEQPIYSNPKFYEGDFRLKFTPRS